MLALNNINLTLNTAGKIERQVIKNLSMHIAAGEFVVIIGANGAGKSTLLNLISGDLTPNNGQILLADKDITQLPAANRSKKIAKVLQNPKVGTIENMTIFENLAFAAKRGQRRGLSYFSTAKNRDVFKTKLSILGMNLENRLDELVVNLSGGQRQALSLIMALMSSSDILLLDEITAALDPNTADHIMQLASRIITVEQRSTIMITHNMQHALTYGDRTLLLREGGISQEYDLQAKANMTPALLAAELL